MCQSDVGVEPILKTLCRKNVPQSVKHSPAFYMKLH